MAGRALVLVTIFVVTVLATQAASKSAPSGAGQAGGQRVHLSRATSVLNARLSIGRVTDHAPASPVSPIVNELVSSTPPSISHVNRARHPNLRRNGSYPIGALSAANPSGRAPPSGNAMAGYTLEYVNSFTGTSLPHGWVTYSGTPGGDPGGQFSSSHVTVSGGLLQINTWQDPAYNNQWVTGGLCQCGLARTYGAYFVRSRVTGSGPAAVELLWPVAPVWPPEIDFSETGGTTSASSATLHYTSASDFVQKKLTIDMTKWHTWGVIWTPASVVYTVDGRTWGSVSAASEIPRQPMTLDLQQQTWCASGWACPTSPQSLQVDWVAEYAPSSSGGSRSTK